jgi:hypothetical protein
MYLIYGYIPPFDSPRPQACQSYLEQTALAVSGHCCPARMLVSDSYTNLLFERNRLPGLHQTASVANGPASERPSTQGQETLSDVSDNPLADNAMPRRAHRRSVASGGIGSIRAGAPIRRPFEAYRRPRCKRLVGRDGSGASSSKSAE